MKKLILLGLMTSLFAFGNNKEVKTMAEEVIPEPGTSAMFYNGSSWLGDRISAYVDNLVFIKVTNKNSDLPATPVCNPIPLWHCTYTDATGTVHTDVSDAIFAYISESIDSTAENLRYDCTLYANAEKIYSHPYAQYMFAEFPALEQVDIKMLDTSQTYDMNCFFEGDTNLKKVDISTFDTTNVTGMLGMFADCNSLTEINFGDSFTTSKVTRMEGMFINCQSLTEIDLSNFDTSKATEMYGMFAGCTSLKKLDLSNFDMSQCANAFYDDPEVGPVDLLTECNSLEYIKSPQKLPKNGTLNLPAQFNPYSGITALTNENLADHPVINLPADKFIYNWKALRTSGGSEGICGALNQGTADNTTLQTLLSDYEKFDNESKTYINAAKDIEGVTIGESVEYITNVLNKTQTTEKDYGIDTTEANSIINTPVLSIKTNLVVIFVSIGLIAAASYYLYNKKRHAM